MQPALFPAPRRTPAPPTAPAEPAPRTGPRLGEPLDAADAELGWRYPYVTPARALEIRLQAEANRRHTREDTDHA